MSSTISNQANGERVKFCYCDESGTGDEPFGLMVGIVADATRMHRTKEEWSDLLEELSAIAGRRLSELHTKNFYPGNGHWRHVSGDKRHEIAIKIINWLASRRHHIVYCAVDKEKYKSSKRAGVMKDELGTVWRFLGLHLVLAMQKYGMTFPKVKGHTIFVFDNEYAEETRFADVILRPPGWSDSYYDRGSNQPALDHVVDVPYFGDSQNVGLIQVADFVAFYLRRFAELTAETGRTPHAGELERVQQIVDLIISRSIGRAFVYPSRNRDEASEFFYQYAPEAIRNLG